MPYVHVIVNGRRVRVPAGRLAGLELKQEAAAQGANLQVGFLLSMRAGRRYRTVDDEELVHVADGAEFVAVSRDDHS
ncbi:MAG TPA: multiubiquitin domain-containing protein [Pseudonocardiaceae bacterium]